MEKLNEELNSLSLEDAESKLASLTKTFEANNKLSKKIMNFLLKEKINITRC